MNILLLNEVIFINGLKIFLSYSSEDKNKADYICEYLESKGKECWIAPRNIVAGAEYGEEIINGIESSNVMVVVFSKSSNASQHVLREVERAVNKRMPVIAFKIEECALSKSMEYFLLSNQWLDATSDCEGMLESLNSSIDKIYSITKKPENDGVVAPGNTIRISDKRIPIILSVIAVAIIGVTVTLLIGSGSKDISAPVDLQEIQITQAVSETDAQSSNNTSETTALTEQTNTSVSGQSVISPIRYSTEETAEIDLDGNGTSDTISYTPDTEGETPSKLKVNGTEYECCNFSTNLFWICDIDTSDNYLEVAVSSFGPSDDYSTEFYRLEDGTLKYIGEVEDMIDGSLESVNSMTPMNGRAAIINGDGTITASRRLDIFQTWFAYTTYTYNPETGSISEHSDIYYPYGKDNMGNFQNAYDFLCSSNEGTNPDCPTTNSEIHLFSDMNKSGETVTFAPQHFMATATDNVNWVYIVGEDGTKGWLYINEDSTAYDAVSGESFDYMSVMENLFLYD